jgi:hypothetical protein
MSETLEKVAFPLDRITEENLNEVAEAIFSKIIRYLNEINIQECCAMLLGYEYHQMMNNSIDSLTTPDDFNVLYAEALQAAKSGELRVGIKNGCVVTTLSLFVCWHVKRVGQALNPIVKQLLEKIAGYRQEGEESSLDEPRIFISIEGDKWPISRWHCWADQYSSVRRFFRENDRVNIAEFACLMHSIIPITMRMPTMNLITYHFSNPLLHMGVVFDVFPDDLQKALRCSEETAKNIKATYFLLRQDCEMVFSEYMPDRREEWKNTHYTNVDGIMTWLSKHNLSFPKGLQQEIENINRTTDVEHDLWSLKQAIFMGGKRVQSHWLESGAWGYAQACWIVMGREEECTYKSTPLSVLPRLYGGMKKRDYESKMYDVYNEDIRTYEPVHGLSGIADKQIANLWCMLAVIYPRMRPKVIEAHNNGEQIFLHRKNDTRAPNTWELRPEAFIRLCHKHGVYIRPQLRERFLSDAGNNAALGASHSTARVDTELANYIERLPIEAEDVGTAKKEYVTRMCKAYYDSADFPVDLKNDKPLSQRAIDRAWKKAKNCKPYQASGNASQRRAVKSSA